MFGFFRKTKEHLVMPELYATVFVYYGDSDGRYHSHTPTYTVGEGYERGEYVIVDFKGTKCAGRILEICNERPDEIPANVNIKPILGHLTKKNVGTVMQCRGLESALMDDPLR